MQQDHDDDFIIRALNLGNEKKWECDFWDIVDELAFFEFTEQNKPPTPEEPSAEPEDELPF